MNTIGKFRGGYGHKLKAILLSIAVAVSGWIIPEMPVHAAGFPTTTLSLDNGIYLEAIPSVNSYDHRAYFYIPKSLGDPLITYNLECHSDPFNDDSDIKRIISYAYRIGYYSTSTIYLLLATDAYESVGSYWRLEVLGYVLRQNKGGWTEMYLNENTYFPYGNVLGGAYWGSYVGYQTWYNMTGEWGTSLKSLRDHKSGYAVSVDIKPHSHSYSTLVSNATCTAAAVYKCSCGATTTSGSALGHSANSGTITANATCTTNGAKAFYCSRCGAYMRTDTIPASGHSWGSGNGAITQNQSCTAPEIRYNKCTRCSATNGTKQTKSALGHDYQTATLTNNNGVKVPADVYHDAIYYQKCSRCSTGHSGDPYTNHYNAVPGTQKRFSIYIGDKRVQAIYIGNTPIMGANIGDNSLVA